MRSVLLRAAVIISLGATTLSSQTSDTLDLTVIRPAPSPPEGPSPFSGPTGGRYSGTRVQKSPLELTLIDLDRTEYRMREPLVFRLRIRNVGAESFPLPWEPDWTRIAVVEGHRVIGCVVRLEVEDDRESSPLLLWGETVFGASSTTGTVKMLAPGQSVDWIVPGEWRLRAETTETAFIRTLPRMLSIRVGLSFYPQPVEGHYYGPVVSRNSVSVTLNPPLVP